MNEHDDCRPTCAARRNPNAECVCRELDDLGVPETMTFAEWMARHKRR